jgi:hypothetical protein
MSVGKTSEGGLLAPARARPTRAADCGRAGEVGRAAAGGGPGERAGSSGAKPAGGRTGPNRPVTPAGGTGPKTPETWPDPDRLPRHPLEPSDLMETRGWTIFGDGVRSRL